MTAKIASAASQAGRWVTSGPSQIRMTTQHDERHVDHRVAEEEDVEDAPRILAEDAEEIS